MVRTRRHPTYHELNKAVVEQAAGVSASELAAEVDALLADADHRRLDVLELADAQRLRPGLTAQGYRAMALLIMRHERPAEIAAPAIEVVEVDFDAVLELRTAWHGEDDPGGGPFTAFYPHYRAVSLARGARVLAVCERGRPVGYAQLEGAGDDRPGVEVAQVYVSAARRGRGLGTALTAAAIAAGRGRSEVWIEADAEDRPRHLYERLGFRPAWGVMEFVRAPR
jgi:ribosomal protein S18 acetylase RimI-like enzyme